MKDGLRRTALLKLMGTFRGWLLRYAVKWAVLLTSLVTGYFAGKWILLEQLAARIGVSADALQTLHESGKDLQDALTGLVSVIVLGGVETVLSRIAAKVKEEPVIPIPPRAD